MSRQAGRPTASWGASSITLLAGQGKRFPLSKLCYAASPWVLCAGLGTTAQKGHKTITEHPKEGCEDVEGSKGKTCQEPLKSLGLSSPEKNNGRPHCSLQLLTRGMEKQLWSLCYDDRYGSLSNWDILLFSDLNYHWSHTSKAHKPNCLILGCFNPGEDGVCKPY